MTINHIDQLTEWWEGAAQVAPMRGDLVIEDVTDEDGPDYRIRNWPGDMREKLSYVRVLSPKPKPAWHDAVAVIACTGEHSSRELFVNHGDDCWLPSHGSGVGASDLLDATPLIEAKVTDEMVRTVLNGYYEMDDVGHDWHADTVTLMRLALTAALGLENA